MSQNENSPRFDISTVLPMGVGIISLFGICLILLANRLAAPRAVIEIPDTATPFHYLFLGTEPGIATTDIPDGTRPVGFAITAQSGFSGENGDLESLETDQPRVTRTATDVTPVLTLAANTRMPTLATRFPAATSEGITNTPITLPTQSGPTATLAPAATRTLTPTSISAAPLGPNTYDDTHWQLAYSGDWISQIGQFGAAEGTLHVSFTVNNTVRFTFTGNDLRIIYQSGSSLGTLTAVIDGTTYPPLNQSGSPSTRSEWAITGLSNDTHNVTLTHSSGGSVNIDQIIVQMINLTPTPTATATSTP